MADEDEAETPAERYQLSIWIAFGPTPDLRDSAEHWFVERPDTGVVQLLLTDAKEAFAALHPGVEPNELSTHITRLRPADNSRLASLRLTE